MIREPTRYKECLERDVDKKVVKMFHLDDEDVTSRLVQGRHEGDEDRKYQQKHRKFQ